MNLRIWIPAILLIISSSYSIQHYYGVFNYYNQFSAKEALQQGEVQLLLYGVVDAEEKLGLNQFEESFDVKVQRVTGETVEASKLNGIKRYNRVMVQHLSKKYGKKFTEALPFRFR